MTATEDGRHDVQLYYRLAPQILAEVRRRRDQGRLRRLYRTHIFPSAVAAAVGANGLARRFYTDMMRRMVRRYAPADLHLLTRG